MPRPRMRLGRLQSGLVALAILFAALAFGTAAWSILAARKNAITEAEQVASNLALALQEHTSSAFLAIDLALYDLVRDHAQEGRDGRLDLRALNGFLAARLVLLPQVRNFAVLDENGDELVEALQFPAPKLNAAEREFFKHHRDDPSRAILISAPVRNLQTRQWVIPASLRIDKPDGSFGGVALAVVEPRYFSNFYKALHIGDDGIVSIVKPEGVLLSREPFRDEFFERPVEMPMLLAALKKAPFGTYLSRSPIDGIERIVAYRTVSTPPIVVVVGLALDTVLAQWRRESTHIAAAAIAVTILFSILIAVLTRYLGRLERAERDFRSIYENATEGIYQSNADGQLVRANPAFVRMCGYDNEAEMLAATKKTDFKWHVDPTTRDRLVERLRTDGRVNDFELQVVRNKTKDWFWAAETARVIKDEAGRILYLEGILIDITARKRAEEELIAARNTAEAANQAKSIFLANMSHELRTPLHAILALSELIRDHSDEPGATASHAEYGKMINDSGRHLLDLINDVLDMSKIEAGRYELTEEDVSLSALVHESLSIVASRAQAASVSLLSAAAEKGPVIRADRRAITQIILNLLSNGVKFTPAGGRVTISLGIGADGGAVLSVSDTGIGIAPEHIKRVMEPFSQADLSHTRKYEGTGLGLPISQRLMEMHGGTIELTSTLGQGVTATARFPKDRTVKVA